jgi:proteasome lid subunit RPN8/RPN11
MIAHVLQTPDEEACGLLSGHGDTITRAFPATNIAEHRATRYEAEPTEVRRIQDEIDDAGQKLLGIYHSHLKSAAQPSETDRRLAAYDVWYIIVSLREPAQPMARAFRIQKSHPADEDGVVREEQLKIVDRLA